MRLRLAAIALCVTAAGCGINSGDPTSPEVSRSLSENASAEAFEAMSFPEKTPGLKIELAETVRQLTGTDSLNATDRWNVHGTDLGHMIRHKGALYMVFGDTYGPEGGDWRSSAMARIDDRDLEGGLAFDGMIERADGTAMELISSARIPGVEWTVIPTNGMSLDDRMILHYMSVRMWTSDGRWIVRRSGLAYSDDDGQSWHRSPTATWANGSGFEQVAFVEPDDGMIYTFGIPQGRYGSVLLRRVTPDAIFDPAAYRYWTGAEWVPDPAAAAAVVPAPAGELSVSWSKAHRMWLMMYLDEEREAIVLRTADDLVGPWSEIQVVAEASDFPGLYAPYMVPGSVIDGEVHFTMSRWKPLYNVFLMKAKISPAMPALAAIEGSPDVRMD